MAAGAASASCSGGFDCELAEKPPEKIDIKCPICLLILREPQQMECGKIVCKSCITDVLAAGVVPTCPLCRRQRPDYWPDKNRKQFLCGMSVFCRHKPTGCDWQGELGDLDIHLNENPSPEKAFEGCKYTAVKCKFCKKPFPRNNIDVHQQEACSKRPYTCQYCGHKATYIDIMEKHVPSECPKLPIPCPHCDVKYQRYHLDNHVQKFCELVHVPCKFHIVGCKEELLRKDMVSHLKKANGSHVAMLNKRLEDCPNPSKQCQALTAMCLELVHSDLQQLCHDEQSDMEQSRRSDEELERKLSLYVEHLKGYKLLCELCNEKVEQLQNKLEELQCDLKQLRMQSDANVKQVQDDIKQQLQNSMRQLRTQNNAKMRQLQDDMEQLRVQSDENVEQLQNDMKQSDANVEEHVERLQTDMELLRMQNDMELLRMQSDTDVTREQVGQLRNEFMTCCYIVGVVIVVIVAFLLRIAIITYHDNKTL